MPELWARLQALPFRSSLADEAKPLQVFGVHCPFHYRPESRDRYRHRSAQSGSDWEEKHSRAPEETASLDLNLEMSLQAQDR